MSKYSPEVVSSFRFSAPPITLTSANMGINGGLSYDIPLAAFTVGQNRALDYMSAHNQLLGKRVMDATMLGGPSIDMTIETIGGRATAPSTYALGTVSRGLDSTLAYISGISQNTIAGQRYATKKSKGGLLGWLGL